jgi:hypothetical protein
MHVPDLKQDSVAANRSLFDGGVDMLRMAPHSSNASRMKAQPGIVLREPRSDDLERLGSSGADAIVEISVKEYHQVECISWIVRA